jgi:hypothetical protein
MGDDARPAAAEILYGKLNKQRRDACQPRTTEARYRDCMRGQDPYRKHANDGAVSVCGDSAVMFSTTGEVARQTIRRSGERQSFKLNSLYYYIQYK